MKSTFILAVTAALAGFTSAQDGLPSCAQSCVGKFTSGSSIGGCKSLDIKCICSSSTFLSDIACCLAAQCNAADQATAVQFAQNLCKTSGVTDLPSAVTCASSATATSSSSTSGSSAAATGATTASGSSSSPTASGGSGSSAVAGSATSKTSAGSSTSSSKASAATAAPSSNVGHQKETGFGAGVFGGLAAVIALL